MGLAEFTSGPENDRNEQKCSVEFKYSDISTSRHARDEKDFHKNLNSYEVIGATYLNSNTATWEKPGLKAHKNLEATFGPRDNSCESSHS